MSFFVQRLDGELKRKAWEFEFSQSGFRLLMYAEQERESLRHKWKGPLWSWMDERPYYSKLARPITIPADVIDEAVELAATELRNAPVFIGWWNSDNILKGGR